MPPLVASGSRFDSPGLTSLAPRITTPNVRWGLALALAPLLLASCIPRGDRRPPARADQPRAEPRESATLQCHIELARENVGYRVLEDRRFDRGCSALGAVQLLEIGTPTTHLGAMTCPLARQFARWARESVVFRLDPVGRALEHPGRVSHSSHAAEPPPSPATTRGPLPSSSRSSRAAR